MGNKYTYLPFLNRFIILLEVTPISNRESCASRLADPQPIDVGFFACLCNTDQDGKSQLRFCCYPIDSETEVRQKICSTFEVLRYGYGQSCEELCRGDVVFVKLLHGLKLRKRTSEKKLKLT